MKDPVLQEETNGLLYPIQPQLPDLDQSPLPEKVFHYTDTSGLLGMLASGVLWATDYRFLNDSSEIAYIYRVASDLVTRKFVGRYEGLAAAFVDHAALTDPPYTEVPYYLCCFSELDNSLSQWRAYGGRQGFSVGLPGDISTVAGHDPRGRQNPGITLLKVNYDRGEQERYITALVEALVGICDAPHMARYKSREEALSSFTPFYWAQLERASYRFKHPDFAVEQEWRLVGWGEVHPEWFRPGTTITPYTKFSPYSVSWSGRGLTGLPLMSVRHGPSELPRETLFALDRALKSHGYDEASCERLQSTTPVRL